MEERRIRKIAFGINTVILAMVFGLMAFFKLCDVGFLVYMGNSEMQAKSLICENGSPIFYKLMLDLQKIPKDRILVLKEKEWLMSILANRRGCEKYNNLSLAKE